MTTTATGSSRCDTVNLGYGAGIRTLQRQTETWLRERDDGTRIERSERLEELALLGEPEQRRMLFGGVDVANALWEAQSAYVNGLDLSAILVSQVCLEKLLSGLIELAPETKANSSYARLLEQAAAARCMPLPSRGEQAPHRQMPCLRRGVRKAPTPARGQVASTTRRFSRLRSTTWILPNEPMVRSHAAPSWRASFVHCSPRVLPATRLSGWTEAPRRRAQRLPGPPRSPPRLSQASSPDSLGQPVATIGHLAGHISSLWNGPVNLRVWGRAVNTPPRHTSDAISSFGWMPGCRAPT